jgi:hypothetical protein
MQTPVESLRLILEHTELLATTGSAYYIEPKMLFER